MAVIIITNQSTNTISIMARRLTAFSKLLIVLLILGGIVFGLKQAGILDQLAENAGDTSNNNNNANTTKPKRNTGGDSKGDVINVGVVTWGGYAGGQYFNEGFDANSRSRFYKDYGFKVNFKVLDDFVASRKAFENDEVDLLWCTIDAFPTESGGLKGDPQIAFQADWSRGGDAIVVKRGIRNVSDLKGKTVAVAQMTPSHSFLIWLLEASGMTINDVKPMYVADAIAAAAIFKNNEADAAVVWSPDDVLSLRAVPGSKILQNTKSASHIIADGFMAKKSFITENRTQLQQLYEGWMKGAAEINSSEGNKRKAAKILADGLNLPEEDAVAMINNVRLTTHGDNLDFFGLNPDYKKMTAEKLYSQMKKKYASLGGDFASAANSAPNWRLVSNPTAVRATKSLTGPAHASEAVKFAPVTKDKAAAPAVATKQVSISFRTGEYQLDDNAKRIIDLEFADIAKAFSNSRVRIEGNTDNTGSRATNTALSKKRAQSVANYLKDTYSMDVNRFIIVGNGPDKPVCNQSTPACLAKNRRTDFELVAE